MRRVRRNPPSAAHAGSKPGAGSGRHRAAWPPVCLGDYERLATAALAPAVAGFVAGGSGAESALRANRTALERLRLVPRVLTGSGDCDTSVSVLGCRLAAPVAVAPMAYQRLVHPEGEIALASAAREAGVGYAASVLGSVPIEQVAGCGAPTWFQLYWLRDRGLLAELIRRAEAAGCAALALTVDVPRMGRRLRDLRSGFALPPGITAANLPARADATAHRTKTGSSALMVHTGEAFDPTLSWADLDWLRERTELPLLVKGILHPDDAVRAVDAGAQALVVSNHGGRQLDGAVAGADALPAVIEAVAGRCQVLLDGGIRSGTDVVKALALGADAILLGRPALWGLAADGQKGASGVLSLLRTEIEDAMVLSGCRDVSEAARLSVVCGTGRHAGAVRPRRRP